MRQSLFYSSFSLTATFFGSCALLLGCNTFSAIARTTPAASSSSAASKGDYVRFKLAHLEDGRSGGSMIDYLVPYGWKNEAKMVWKDGTNAHSPIYSISVESPQGTTVGGVFSGMLTYMGGRFSQPSPIPEFQKATDYDDFVLKNTISNRHLTDVTIVKRENKDMPLNSLEKITAQNVHFGGGTYFKQMGTLQGKAKINGQNVVFTIVASVNGSITGTWNTFIGGSYIVSSNMVIFPTNATKRLMLETYGSTMSMYRMTPHFGKYMSMLVDASIEASRREINDPSWHERFMNNFRNQMAGHDATEHRELNYIRDQNDYETPGGGTVTLPYFNSAWSDGHGGYVMSDDKTFNPSGLGGSWSHLKRKGV